MATSKLNNMPTTPSPDSSFPSSKRTLILILLTSIVLVLALLWFIYWFLWQRFEEYTDDAYVNGNVVQLMSQVQGTVTAIHTDDTYLVRQGQPIIFLNPIDMQVNLQQAQAHLASTVRQVRQYFENAQRAQAQLSMRSADFKKAELDFNRRLGLVKARAISEEELAHYKTTLNTARSAYQEALYSLRSALALVENGQLYTHPLVEEAKAALKSAYLNLERTTIVAPTTGYVAQRNVQVGQQIQTHTPLLAIIPLNDLWIEANYKETQLDNLRIGQPVTLSADAYPGVVYHGKIMGLSAGTGAAFSLLPPQNATGNWIKIVQRLPVRIRLNPKELKQHPLQIGLSMHVTTDIHQLHGHRLAPVALQKAIYTTDVYQYQHALFQAQMLINTILRQNSPDMLLKK